MGLRVGPNCSQHEFVFPQPCEWHVLGDHNAAKLNKNLRHDVTLFVNASGRGMAAHKYVPDSAGATISHIGEMEIRVFHHINYQKPSLLVRQLNTGSLVLNCKIEVLHIPFQGADQVKCVASRAMTGADVWTEWYDVKDVLFVKRLVSDIRDHLLMEHPRMSANFKIALIREGTTECLHSSRQVWNPKWMGQRVAPQHRIVGKQASTLQHTLHHFFVKKATSQCGTRAAAMRVHNEHKLRMRELEYEANLTDIELEYEANLTENEAADNEDKAYDEALTADKNDKEISASSSSSSSWQ
jgi:hypothetical protein